MDNKTLSLHGGRMASIEHNRRVQGKEGKHSTIKNELSDNNVTLIDIDIKEAYKQVFSEAVDEYNKTQKRSDRKIKNYYSKIRNDKKKNTHYEYIFSLGNIKNRIDDDTFVAVCSDYIASFQERNPNLYLVGAYVHLDETANPHMHIDYIPVAHYDRGLKLQASSNKAFEELTNYKSTSKRDTAQIKWQETEREYIREFCRDYGIEVIDGDSKGKKSLSIEQYKAQKDLEQAKLEQQQAELLKQNADAEIQRQDTRIQSAKSNADKQIQAEQQRVESAIKSIQTDMSNMETELSDAQKRFRKVQHKLNSEYDELVRRNDIVDSKLNDKIDVLNDVEQMIADHINKVSEELPGFEPVGIRVANKINKDIQRLSESLDDLDR